MLSKTEINKRMNKKTNPELARAIYLAKKKNFIQLASELSRPTRLEAKVNLEQLNKTKSDIAIIPGKVLGNGNIDKKIKVYALSFSKSAQEKLKKAGCEFEKIINLLEKSKKLEGEIIR